MRLHFKRLLCSRDKWVCPISNLYKNLVRWFLRSKKHIYAISISKTDSIKVWPSVCSASYCSALLLKWIEWETIIFFQLLQTFLPAVLCSNPFTENKSRDLSVMHAAETFTQVCGMLRKYDVTHRISEQLLSYLLSFTNAFLFNILMEKGKTISCRRKCDEELETFLFIAV